MKNALTILMYSLLFLLLGLDSAFAYNRPLGLARSLACNSGGRIVTADSGDMGILQIVDSDTMKRLGYVASPHYPDSTVPYNATFNGQSVAMSNDGQYAFLIQRPATILVVDLNSLSLAVVYRNYFEGLAYPQSIVSAEGSACSFVTSIESDNKTVKVSSFKQISTGELELVSSNVVASAGSSEEASVSTIAVAEMQDRIYVRYFEGIAKYSYDPTSCALSDLSKYSGSENGTSLAVAPSGARLFRSNPYTSEIELFNVDSSSGALTLLSTLSGYKADTLLAARDGSLYATNFDGDLMYQFSFADGAISYVRSFSENVDLLWMDGPSGFANCDDKLYLSVAYSATVQEFNLAENGSLSWVNYVFDAGEKTYPGPIIGLGFTKYNLRSINTLKPKLAFGIPLQGFDKVRVSNSLSFESYEEFDASENPEWNVELIGGNFARVFARFYDADGQVFDHTYYIEADYDTVGPKVTSVSLSKSASQAALKIAKSKVRTARISASEAIKDVRFYSKSSKSKWYPYESTGVKIPKALKGKIRAQVRDHAHNPSKKSKYIKGT